MKIKQANVTPALAREFLKSNTDNRNVRASHVDFLANEMRSGRWVLNPSPISIGENGVLLDGQHRLLAIIQSGVTVPLMIAHDVAVVARDVIDTNLGTRSVGDILHMTDGLSDANLKVAAVKHIISMCSYFQSFKVSPGLARSVISQFEKELGMVVGSCREFKPGARGWMIGTLAFCLSGDKRSADFIHKFYSGDDLRSGDPAKAARNWVLNRNSSHLSNTFRKGATQCFCNTVFNSIHGNTINQVKSGHQGIDYFFGKRREFVNTIRQQMIQPEKA